MAINLVHVISSLDVGGAETTLFRLISRMNGEHFTNRVVSLIPPGPIGKSMVAAGVPVNSLLMRRGHASPGAFFRLVRLLREERTDIVQTWLYHADLLGLLSGRVAGLRRVVWNICSSDMDMSRYRWLSGVTRGSCARLSRFPEAVVASSEAGRRFHVAIGYRPKRWAVIPNGVDGDVFRPDPAARRRLRAEIAVSPEEVLIGLVARYDPMKDHSTFLRAASILRRNGAVCHFVLAGDGVTAQNPALSKLVVDGGLLGTVHMLGRREDVPHLQAALDIATLSSVSESFPNVLVEAMSCGVPCVVTDVGDAARIVEDTGIVVPPGDPSALARGWEELLARGAEARRSLGARARLRVERQFSLDRMVDSYEKLYSSIAEPSSTRAEPAQTQGARSGGCIG